LRILWIKVGGLWPPNTGGRLRSLHTLAELSRRHRVTLLTTHASPAEAEALRGHLAQCERVISLPYTAPKWRSLRFPLLLLRSWFSRLPVDLFKSRVPALRSAAESLIAAGEVDLCIADFLCAMPNVPRDCRVPVIYFSHNVEHMIWRRLCSNAARLWQRLPLELEWRKMRRCEAAASRQARLTIAVSEQDRALLSELAPDTSIRAVATGVDIAYFAPRKDIQPRVNRMVFVGSMDWQPNEDAILYFMEAILPQVRAHVPAATLSVVGRNPSERLRREAERAGVEITGTVNDVRDFMADAAVYIVPLRIGGGTRLKIYEALAMGKAVVSTTIGAEGLPLEHGVHFLQADVPQAFADAVVALLKDPQQCERLGAAGRQLVEAHYSWAQVAAEFESLIETAMNESAVPSAGTTVVEAPVVIST
jgi:glycosyltransferase involved in cell wall biosynthesis